MNTVQMQLPNGSIAEVGGVSAMEGYAGRIFRDWLESLDRRFRVTRVEFQSVDLVGSSDNKRVLFIKFKADVTDSEGNFIPGIVFIRGGAIGVLVIIECEEEEYTVLTVQPRFPVGSFEFPEIPAGMLDGDGNLAGKAADELREEAGIDIRDTGLFDLTEAVYGDRWRGMYPSSGGCDEFIRLFLYRTRLSREDLAELQGRIGGLPEEGEAIRLRVVPLADLPAEAPDSKALSALALYRYLGERGKLPTD